MKTPWPIQFHARVTKVYDGDTIDAVIYADAGLNVWVCLGNPVDGSDHWRIRFYGINAPELATDAGRAALAFLDTLVLVGDWLTLDSYGFDKDGKRIDAVPHTADGMDLCQAMLDSGNAVIYP